MPAFLDMLVQRAGAVLGEYKDLAKPGIYAIAEGKINDAVFTTERYSSFGSDLGERHQPFTFSPCQYNCEQFVHSLPRKKPYPVNVYANKLYFNLTYITIELSTLKGTGLNPFTSRRSSKLITFTVDYPESQIYNISHETDRDNIQN